LPRTKALRAILDKLDPPAPRPKPPEPCAVLGEKEASAALATYGEPG